jgi:hypothetical protein
MNQRIERLWVDLTSSEQFRRFAKGGAGAGLFRSEAYRRLNLARRYALSAYRARMSPGLFQPVQTFCLFVGHNKSGASLTSALLDAHPDAICADEEDSLQYVPAGFRREQIFHLLLWGSRREALKGRVTARRLTPYSYQVPGQWQGRHRTLRVIGESTTGTTTRRIAGDPGLLDRLQAVMGSVEVKLIQVIRNPYDPISVMMVRGRRSFENSIEHYFASCDTLLDLRRRLAPERLHAVRYEEFVRDPETVLAGLCRFLGLEPEAGYLRACAGILHEAPATHRQLVPWDTPRIEAVARRIAGYDFLHGYSFEEVGVPR